MRGANGGSEVVGVLGVSASGAGMVKIVVMKNSLTFSRLYLSIASASVERGCIPVNQNLTFLKEIS